MHILHPGIHLFGTYSIHKVCVMWLTSFIFVWFSFTITSSCNILVSGEFIAKALRMIQAILFLRAVGPGKEKDSVIVK